MVDESDGATADIRSSVNNAAATPHQKLVQAMPKWSFKSQMSLLVHKESKIPLCQWFKVVSVRYIKYCCFVCECLGLIIRGMQHGNSVEQETARLHKQVQSCSSACTGGPSFCLACLRRSSLTGGFKTFLNNCQELNCLETRRWKVAILACINCMSPVQADQGRKCSP